jgi:hypothetical protein
MEASAIFGALKDMGEITRFGTFKRNGVSTNYELSPSGVTHSIAFLGLAMPRLFQYSANQKDTYALLPMCLITYK